MNPALQEALYSSMLNPNLNQGRSQYDAVMPGYEGSMPPFQAVQESFQPGLVPESNPINAGTLAAIKASKQAYKMDEDEQRRAQGLAIQQFFANMAASDNPDQLGRINESFNPAIKAYLAEQNRVQNLNAAIMEQQAKHQEREEDRALKRQLVSSKLGSGKNIENREQQLMQLRESGAIRPNATPMSFYTPGERQTLIKNQLTGIQRANDAGEAIKILEEMRKVNNDFPELATSIDRSLVESSKGKSMFDIAKLKLAFKRNPELVTAAQKMNKLSSDLALFEIKGLGGQRSTDMMRDIIVSTKPDTHMTHDAIEYMINHIDEQLLPVYEEGEGISQDMSQGTYSPPIIAKRKNKKEGEKSAKENVPRGTENTANTAELVTRWRALHPEASHIPDEYILRGIQEGKLK